MPELPEAETVRAQLEPRLLNQRIERAWARLPRRTLPNIADWTRELEGSTIKAAMRRGKQIYFPLDNGSNLLIHLGMTGRLHVEPGGADFDPDSAPRHVHAVLCLSENTRLVFTDPRTFGAVGVSRDLPFIAAMGPEPLDADFDQAALAGNLAGRKTKIKAAILDQRLVAGLGNIYADEVCFLAGVHPEQRACDVPPEKLRELIKHMEPTLRRAIAARGATLRDGGYKDTEGNFGSFRPQAYGRKGEECDNCQALIQRGVLGPGKSARSYHFCPSCQPLAQIGEQHTASEDQQSGSGT